MAKPADRQPHRWVLILGLICMTLLSGNTSLAAGSSACSKDLAIFCRDVKPGGGALSKRLKAHESELSPACRADLAQTQQRQKHRHLACQADVDKFCKSIQPGDGRILDRLKSHQTEVSAPCREEMAGAWK